MSDTRLAGVLFLAALLLRIVMYLGTALFGTDSGQFLMMADRMSEGRFHEALSVTYHPMYPLLIAALKALGPSTEHAGHWVSIVLGSAAAIPLFWTVRSIFGRPAAFLTTLIYCFQPHTVEIESDVMSEGTFFFFFFWTVWLCWRAMEEPSLERSILAGMAACGAYLTRPEGILSVAFVIGWPLVELLRKRDRVALRLGGVGLSALVVGLMAFPFLLWIHAVTEKWSFSAKGSVQLAQKSVDSTEDPSQRPVDPDIKPPSTKPAEVRYPKFFKSLGRMTYFVAAPFIPFGFFALRGLGWRGPLFYFSFPLAYLGGLLYAMRTVGHTSYRYVMSSMDMIMVLAALGVVVLIRFAAARWPERKWVPMALVLFAVLTLGMTPRCLNVYREHEVALREAGAWIRARNVPKARVCSTVDKIGWLSGSRVVEYDLAWPDFERFARIQTPDFYVYLEKDLAANDPPYLRNIREAGGIGEAIVFPNPPRPGAMKVYVHCSEHPRR